MKKKTVTKAVIIVVGASLLSAVYIRSRTPLGTEQLVTAKTDYASIEHPDDDVICDPHLRDGLYIFCDPTDWSCSSNFFHNLARELSSNNFRFIFNTTCLTEDVRPRIFFTGGIAEHTEIQRQRNSLFENSDGRILLHFEPNHMLKVNGNTELSFDVAISSVHPYYNREQLNEALSVLYFPYGLLSLFQMKGDLIKENDARNENKTYSATPVPELFGVYASSHCRSVHRVIFYNLIARTYKPLHYLNKKCGKYDEASPDGLLSDRGDENNFMASVTSRYSKYKFAIVFEPGGLPGYVTEKILLAKMGGSVPVYYGDRHFKQWEDVNTGAYIDCSPDPGGSNPVDSLVLCLKVLRTIDSDDSAWRAMQAKPLFKQPLQQIMKRSVTILSGVAKSFLKDQGQVSELCRILTTAAWPFPPSYFTRECIASASTFNFPRTY
uniref:Uncharacterized protein n=1 Tax=Micromonas pusilla TaxID=38833 RepID=A0A7R9TN60_MICPS|mmetsp:Transcript_4356/g.15361  ORF Transcript_4356/g.15361 Transcript_4356/m.15361 type:complete len:437 (+) Transcript_4356:93-1403(+)